MTAWWEHPEHQEFVNELLDNAPDSYDGDDAAEAIAIRYVRDLERAARLADDMVAVIRRQDDGWFPDPDGEPMWLHIPGHREPMTPGEVTALQHAREVGRG